MGVTGLWKLIEPSGKPVPLETLENKVLAIDISIWLHQVVKGFQDNKGNTLAHAHLLGLFHRLCKLLYYRIKPVFVFDGCVPQLKKETIAKRNQSRNKILNEADRLQQLLLNSLAKEKIVQEALGTNACEKLTSPIKNKEVQKKPERDDIFKLPENKIPELNISDSSYNESDSSFEEKNLRKTYNINIQAIDVNSTHFKSLPADVRHEILNDIKETRKQSSWGRLHELPAESDEFSIFQMRRLLKRRQVQIGLEEAEKQMGGKSLTLTELQSLLSEDGVIKSTSTTKPVASDENTRFLLVRDLKKAIENAEKSNSIAIKGKNEAVIKTENKKSSKENDVQFKNETVYKSETEGEINKKNEDIDLQAAIMLSLQNSSNVYDDNDYICDDIKMNNEQVKRFKSSAQSLAKAYMVEYTGMNDSAIETLLNRDNEGQTEQLSFPLKKQAFLTLNEEEVLDLQKVSSVETKNESDNKNQIAEISENEYISSDSDNDFIEVTNLSTLAKEKKDSSENALEIVVDLTKQHDTTEDLFADVFSANETKSKITENENIRQEQILKSINFKTEDLSSCSNNKINDILTKLKEDYDNVPKLTLDDIDIKAKHDQTNDTDMIEKQITCGTYTNNNENISSELSISSYPKTDVENIPKINVVKILDCSNLSITSAKKLNDDPINEVIVLSDDDQLLETPKKSKLNQKQIESFFEKKSITAETPKNQNASTINSEFQPTFSGKKTPKSIDRNKTKDFEINKEKKISKVLFVDDNKLCQNDVSTIKDSVTIAGMTLRNHKSEDELKDIAKKLSQEKRNLEYERNRQDRMGSSITEKMNYECKQLLKLFGVPYIVAPMEAEAQCAFLDAIQLTDGTITDDSDIWLFGGRTVYKNFFNQNKHVMEFKVNNIENLFNVDRKKLIQLAILVGSDYTSGINGIGAVTALEILAAFSTTPEKEDETTDAMSILSSLRKFKEWWKSRTSFNTETKSSLRKKLNNIELGEGFPNINVVEAYLRPKINDSNESFCWGYPDTETIREFTKKNFGWTKNKTDEILQPVLRKLSERKSQTSITKFFSIEKTKLSHKFKVSKRVQKAIDKMSLEANCKDQESEIENLNTKKKNKVKNKNKNEETNIKPKIRKMSVNKNVEVENIDQKNSTSNTKSRRLANSNIVKNKRKVILPGTSSEIIPQREKDKLEMLNKRKEAAKILKKASNI